MQVDKRHEFRLTPDALVLTERELLQFEEIGRISLGLLKATSRLYFRALEQDRNLPKDVARFVIQALESGLSKTQRKAQRVKSGEFLPPVFRVDCLLTRDVNGGVVVSTNEIEAGRPVGLGFGCFTEQIRKEVFGDSAPGLIEKTVEAIKERVSPEGAQIIVHILGEDELFYLPEQELFCQRARKLGLTIVLIREKDLRLRGGEIDLGTSLTTDTILYLPTFNPGKSGKRGEEQVMLFEYEHGSLRILFPPKRFLGSKSVYALAHHPFLKRFYLEAIGADEGRLERYIPKSCLITGSSYEAERLMLETGRQTKPPVMIKAVGLSASRGMAFPGERQEIERLLEVARNNPFQYMTQEFREPIPCSFRVERERGRLAQETHFLRLAAFYTICGGEVELAEVVGTGLRAEEVSKERPAIHGSPSCIMFPVMFR